MKRTRKAKFERNKNNFIDGMHASQIISLSKDSLASQVDFFARLSCFLLPHTTT